MNTILMAKELAATSMMLQTIYDKLRESELTVQTLQKQMEHMQNEYNKETTLLKSNHDSEIKAIQARLLLMELLVQGINLNATTEDYQP